MTIRKTLRILCLAVVVGAAGAAPVTAQPKLSPAALLMAKEIIDLKQATRVFDPIVSGVIEYHKRLFLQTNPNLAQPLEEVARHLQEEFQPRKTELHQELAHIYARHFTEAELKAVLAFYRSPIGKKLIAEEPKILDEAMKNADEWSKKLAAEVTAKFRAEMKKKGYNLI